MKGKINIGVELKKPIQILIGGGFITAIIGAISKIDFLKGLWLLGLVIGVLLLLPYIFKKNK